MPFLYFFSPLCLYFIKSTHRICSNHQFLIRTTPDSAQASVCFIFTILFTLTVFKRYNIKFDHLYVCFFLLNNAEGPPHIFSLIYKKARKYIRNAKCYNQTITIFLPSKRHITSIVKEPSCIINSFLHYQSYSIIIYTLI